MSKTLNIILGLICTLFVTISCSTSSRSQQSIQQDKVEVYRSSGVERFFLPQLNELGRISELSKCMTPAIQYFDFNELSKKYGFNYKQSLSLQVFYAQRTQGQKDLSKKDFNQIFYESFEKVDSGAKTFTKIRSSQLFVVSIDSLKKPSQIELLRRAIQSKLLPKAQVALISRCRTSNEIDKFKVKYNLYPQLIAIGAEYFSHYNKKLEKQYFWSTNIQNLIENKKIIYITNQFEEKQLIQGSIKQWDFSSL